AVKYMAERKFEEAVLAYNEVIRIDAKNTTAYKGLSLAYSLQNKVKEAKAALDKGLKAMPGNADLTLAMAGFLVDHKQPAAAEVLYRQLIANKPQYPAYQAYVRFLVDQKRGSEAIPIIQTALTNNPEEYRLQTLESEVYLILGKTNEAQIAAISSIENEPDQTKAYMCLAEIYKDRWQDLQIIGDQYIKQDKIETGQLLKMYALIQMGQYQTVIDQAQTVVEVKNLVRTRVWLAFAQYKSGQRETAVQTLSTLKSKQIKDALLLSEIAGLYMNMGDKTKAREMALRGTIIDNTVVQNYAILSLLDNGIQKRIWEITWALETPDTPDNAMADLKAAAKNTPAGLLSKAVLGLPVIENQNDVDSNPAEAVNPNSASPVVPEPVKTSMQYTFYGITYKTKLDDVYKIMQAKNIEVRYQQREDFGDVVTPVENQKIQDFGIDIYNNEVACVNVDQWCGIKWGDKDEKLVAMYGTGEIMKSPHGDLTNYGREYKDQQGHSVWYWISEGSVKSIQIGHLNMD
ncbi:MAG: tetratricopeptide repeat protein, partial [Ignavibacteriales bacterium]